MEKLTGVAYNLPYPLTSFIGREAELAEITQLLDGYRLVTLTGPGGVGKTRLALQYGYLEAQTNRVETCFVELASLLSGQFLIEAVAQALNLKDFTGQPSIDVLINFLKDRPVLLVLDNCEHLLEDCARLSAVLITRCPTLKIIATSRETFGIAGEVALRVPSLAFPDLSLEAAPEKLLTYEAQISGFNSLQK